MEDSAPILMPWWLFIVIGIIIFINIRNRINEKNELLRKAEREKEILEES